MANPEHLAKLQEGVEQWNAWYRAALVENLSRADLRGADLGNADLREADLRYAVLSGANLSGANLSGAYLRGSSLSDADLRYAALNHADLIDAALRGANLRAADLRHANLSNADLRSANLRDAKLGGADLGGADLGGADLGGALILETVFSNTGLSGAQGLDACGHIGPATLDHRTIERSGPLPLPFLRGCGLPDTLIDYLPSLLGQAIDFYSCFISYSSADEVFARRLHDQLQGRGIRCWLDEHDVLPGDKIYDAIDRGIKLWDKVLLCCSKSSLDSWWVDIEIDKALEKERRLKKERQAEVLALIPIDLDGYMRSDEWTAGKASIVRSRSAPDFIGWEKDNAIFEAQLNRVVKALRSDDFARRPVPESKL